MSTATVGRAKEYKVRDHLLTAGWAFPLRSAASKGVADLTLFKPGRVLLVQVKASDPYLLPIERQRLLAMADWVGLTLALPVVAATPNRKPIVYRLLTGPGHDDWAPWDPGGELVGS